MRTAEFEQRVRKAMVTASASSWPDLLVQKLHLRKLKVKLKTQYAGVAYQRVAKFEVPLVDSSFVLLTIGFTGTDYDFYYFGFDPDENSTEDLDDLFSKYLMMRALKGNLVV